MFEPSASPRLFGLPPGADFPQELVTGLIERMRDAPPEAMARVELYVNTRRMARRIREVFDAQGACLLPRLRLVTDLGRDPLAGLPPPVPPLRRRLELAQLAARLVAAEPGFAPGTAVYDLADSLARLMDEMQGEGVQPERLEAPGFAEDHAEHWQRSLRFIRIVGRYFAADAPPDPEARQRRVIETLAARWAESPPEHPVIVAGSTGSRGATALFLHAAARLPQGAVVLPGFDFDMPGEVWEALSAGRMPAEEQPQFRFHRLMRALDLPPEAVARWTGAEPPSPARNRLISLSLRPAPVTDRWMAEGQALPDLIPATEGMTLIEAPAPRAEAMALALCLRKAAEDGRHAALVTPDRLLARRVAAALDRWGIRPDDSGGQPLALTAPGRFLRHVAALSGRRVTIEALLTLLKHPLAATGCGGRGDHLRFTRDLELRLRRHGPAFPARAELLAWAEASGEAERIAWAGWVAGVLDRVPDGGEMPLSAWIETHFMLAETLAAGPEGRTEVSELWREAAGREALRVMSELRCEAEHGGAFTPGGYADLVSTLLHAASAREAEVPHPLIAIWGTLEARVQGADLVILGGLNEGTWPETPAPDPWLSRKMRHEAGLLLPERQIGLAAHDFQQAACAPEVILSRARRDAEAETVASRWLSRLTNLMAGLPDRNGPQALEAMRARGDRWLDLARAAEAPHARAAPAPRPAPRPPVEKRPRELAVTAISQLIRDPYAIYARHVLRLKPLDPLRPAADARERGQALHRIVEMFVRTLPERETPEEARARLLAAADRVLAEDIPWPVARRLWRARLERAAPLFLAGEVGRRARGAPVVIEEKGSVPLESPVFTLTARPDRIDLLNDGRVHVYDYKTGKPPSPKQQQHFDKQLLLEAAMAERGGFAALGPREVEGVTYIGLGRDGGEVTTPIDDALLAETWEGLRRLIASYLRRETGYASRRAVEMTGRIGDYDHLARFGEWDMADAPEPEDVG